MDEKIYKKCLGVSINKIDKVFYVVYEYDVYELNEVGARILDLCNGRNSVEDIVHKISTFYGEESNHVITDAQGYINLLLNYELIKLKSDLI